MLDNDVKDRWGSTEGVYTIQGFSGGMEYWVHTDGEHAIWYLSSGSNYYWQIGTLENLGTYAVAMYSNTLEKKCPNNDEGNVWNWMFFDYTTYSNVETNDVDIKCVNEGGDLGANFT